MSYEPFVVTVEGAEDFERSWLSAFHDLEQNAALAAYGAAEEGVRVMQARHPYTDRTYGLSMSMCVAPEADRHDGDDVERCAAIEVRADYASFVDRGTSRAKPYPFTPRGEDAAERAATRYANVAVKQFERTCRRG
jgi:hypothetical protein